MRCFFIVAAALSVWLAPGCKADNQAAGTRDERAASGQREVGAEVGAEVVAGAEAGAGADEPAHMRFATAGEALAHILATVKAEPGKPRVIGIGEFHQTTDSAPARSAIERFIDALDVIVASEPRATDLIVETWVEAGACGEREAVVSKDVREVTRRPPVVENHVLRLLAGARERAVMPHVLKMTCTDYEYLSSGASEGDEVDYEKMLGLIKRKLAEVATRVASHRLDRAGAEPGKKPGTIVLYGGALHNDLHPTAGLEFMSYAADLLVVAGGGYAEIDLYVPEYIEGNPLMAQEPWYPVFVRESAPDRVLVFERSPRSFIVVLRKGVAP